MDTSVTEIHQVGADMVHLVRERSDSSDGYLALVEGGGICLANYCPTPDEADAWLQTIFSRLYSGHRCGLGCLKMPGSEFIATPAELDRLLRLEDPRPL